MTLARLLPLHICRRAASVLGVVALMVTTQAFSAAPLPESVVMVQKKSGLFTTELETTLYLPEGDGPFPIAVINHGKANGDPKFQDPTFDLTYGAPGAVVRDPSGPAGGTAG